MDCEGHHVVDRQRFCSVRQGGCPQHSQFVGLALSAADRWHALAVVRRSFSRCLGGRCNPRFPPAAGCTVSADWRHKHSLAGGGREEAGQRRGGSREHLRGEGGPREPPPQTEAAVLRGRSGLRPQKVPDADPHGRARRPMGRRMHIVIRHPDPCGGTGDDRSSVVHCWCLVACMCRGVCRPRSHRAAAWTWRSRVPVDPGCGPPDGAHCAPLAARIG